MFGSSRELASLEPMVSITCEAFWRLTLGWRLRLPCGWWIARGETILNRNIVCLIYLILADSAAPSVPEKVSSQRDSQAQDKISEFETSILPFSDHMQ